MNKELEEAKKVLNMWNKAEEIVINEDTSYDKKIYIQRKRAIETVLNYIDNSISKKEIEEKIEELNKDIEDYLKTDKSGRFTRTNCIFTYKIETLQELLNI